MAFQYTLEETSKTKIFIDPGHGGSGPNGDRSNMGPTGYVEADGVLAISKYLRDELNRTGAFEVKLSRETDTYLEVRERGDIAAAWGADLFISQHSNAANGQARGVEIYYSVSMPSDQALASSICSAVADAMGTYNRGAKTWVSTWDPNRDYLGVIDASRVGGVKHAFLIESGFHDNSEDEALLKQDAVLKKIAIAQAKEICRFYNVTYPPVAIKGTLIMGASVATADQLYRLVMPVNAGSFAPKISIPLYELCQTYLDEGAKEGVRGDIAFCQSCIETNKFTFTGLAKPEWNNFCGLGVTGGYDSKGEPVGEKFDSPRTGIRAQIQHLKAYASTEPLNQPCVDARFQYIKRGRAPYWEWLGRDENPENATRDASDRQGWAVPGTNYGHSIIDLFKTALLLPQNDSNIPKFPVPSLNVITAAGVVAVKTPFTIRATGTNCFRIALYINGVYVYASEGNSFSYTFTPTETGKYSIELKARNTEQGVEGSTLVSSGIHTLVVVDEGSGPVDPPLPPVDPSDTKGNGSVLLKIFELILNLLKKIFS